MEYNKYLYKGFIGLTKIR